MHIASILWKQMCFQWSGIKQYSELKIRRPSRERCLLWCKCKPLWKQLSDYFLKPTGSHYLNIHTNTRSLAITYSSWPEVLWRQMSKWQVSLLHVSWMNKPVLLCKIVLGEATCCRKMKTDADVNSQAFPNQMLLHWDDCWY